MNNLGIALLVSALCITSFFLGESSCHYRYKEKIEFVKARMEEAKVLVNELKDRMERLHKHSRKKS